MQLTKTVVVAAMLALALSGCSSKGGVQDEDEAAAGAGDPGAGGPKISRYGQPGAGGAYGSGAAGSRYGAGGAYGSGAEGAGASGAEPGAGPASERVVYFLYDSYEVQLGYQSVVSAHAAYLASHPERNVVLEGHADERGSPEYNVALGEQRAQAVARMMQLQGAGNGQIQVVSYGEEKPADSGHDESSWQRNRRVEISYPGQ